MESPPQSCGAGQWPRPESKQDIDRQITALKQVGADAIHFEYEHGDAEHKKELEKLLATAAPGDTILTMEVSRLARSTKQLCGLIDTVKERRLRLVGILLANFLKKSLL